MAYTNHIWMIPSILFVWNFQWVTLCYTINPILYRLSQAVQNPSSQGLGHAVAAAGSAGAGGDLLYVGHVGDADQDLQASASEMAKGGYAYSFYYIFTLW